MKRKYYKGDVILFYKNGEQTGQSTNLDQDRELTIGEIFEHRFSEKVQPTKMRLLSFAFPLEVEEMDEELDKERFSIHELEHGKLYDMVGNPFPNHILYYVDEEGNFCHKDLIVKTQGKRSVPYNEIIQEEFYEV